MEGSGRESATRWDYRSLQSEVCPSARTRIQLDNFQRWSRAGNYRVGLWEVGEDVINTAVRQGYMCNADPVQLY